MPPPDEKPTERLADRALGPLATTRTQRVIHVSWNGGLGAHETTIDAATTLGSAPGLRIVPGGDWQ